ncbi:MAG: hypothetical protein PVH61_29100 [Candidatus Aminicenantes bacterium]
MQRKNSLEIKPIRHINPGFQLYPQPCRKSSPQIYRDRFTGNAFNNLNNLKKLLLNYRILNEEEKSSFITFGCININELKGPGSGGGRRPQLIYVHRDDVVYWASSRVSIKGTMVMVEINKKVGYKKSSQIDTAARGLLFLLVIGHWGEGLVT